MKKILIIDDEAPILRHFQDLLRLLQYEPIIASNSEEGCRLAAKENLDLIISDLVMPGEINNIDHIRKLRDICPHTPLVVISGYPTEETVEECEQLGVQDFLTKPFELSYISSVLERLVPNSPKDI